MLGELLLPDVPGGGPVAGSPEHLGPGQLLQLLQVPEEQLLLLLLLLIPQLPV